MAGYFRVLHGCSNAVIEMWLALAGWTRLKLPRNGLKRELNFFN
jgi:hypothetical protein